MEGSLVQLNFLAALHGVSHCGLLHKFRSIGIGGEFLSIVSQFLCVRRQRLRLDGKVSVSEDVILGCPLVVF